MRKMFIKVEEDPADTKILSKERKTRFLPSGDDKPMKRSLLILFSVSAHRAPLPQLLQKILSPAMKGKNVCCVFKESNVSCIRL